MVKKLVCINNDHCWEYISIGNAYDVSVLENGNISFINDNGYIDVFHRNSIYKYFMDIEVYRGNVIEDILS